METYTVKFRRTVSVRHAVEEHLEVEVEGETPDAARQAVQTLIDGGDTEGQWEEGQDKIVGSDVVGYEFDEAVPSGDVVRERQHAAFLGWLKLAADEPDRLRRVDVDRVMTAVPAPLREEFKAWLLPQVSMHAVREAVGAWTPDD